MKRKTRKSRQDADGTLHDRTHPASGKLVSSTPVRTCLRIYEEMLAAQFKFEQLQQELRDRLGL